MARRKITSEENTVTATTDEPNFDAPEFDETDTVDADFDAPTVTDAEDAVVTQPVAEGEKPAKEKKEPARPPVPEGKVSPVKFAKILTEHLQANGKLEADKSVAPQVVYSYIKNNGPESKNPFPAEKAEGRAAVVDADAAIAWWDAKDARVAASKQAKLEKDAAKAAKATEPKAEGAPAEVTEAPELVEAE
jgi:hypothetical protein